MICKVQHNHERPNNYQFRYIIVFTHHFGNIRHSILVEIVTFEIQCCYLRVDLHRKVEMCWENDVHRFYFCFNLYLTLSAFSLLRRSGVIVQELIPDFVISLKCTTMRLTTKGMASAFPPRGPAP